MSVAGGIKCLIVHADLVPAAQDCLGDCGDVALFIPFASKINDVLQRVEGHDGHECQIRLCVIKVMMAMKVIKVVRIFLHL